MLPAQNSYLDTQIKTSSPGELTLMLYNGCIRFIKLGMSCIDNQDINGKHNYFMRAQDILDELQSTLDMGYEISANLNSLYIFIQSKLRDANINLNRESAEDCIKLMSELRDTWSEALKSLKTVKGYN